MNVIETRILNTIKKDPGLLAREIGDMIGLTRKEVNHYLYDEEKFVRLSYVGIVISSCAVALGKVEIWALHIAAPKLRYIVMKVGFIWISLFWTCQDQDSYIPQALLRNWFDPFDPSLLKNLRIHTKLKLLRCHSLHLRYNRCRSSKFHPRCY